MIKVTYFARKSVVVLLSLVAAISVTELGSAPTLTAPVRQSDGSVAVTINGNSGESVVLQGSADMRTWADLQTYQVDGPVTFRQAASEQARYQYFRLKTGGTVPPPSPLTDLSTLANAVFPAGEGFNTVQFAPNGTLGMIFWNGRNLTMRERTTSGQWRQEIVSGSGNLFQANITRHDYKFQPAALLLYDSNSQPHIFRAAGGKAVAHHVRTGNAWAESERMENSAANGEVNQLVGALGPNNQFHLAVISGGATPNLSYGSNRAGGWSWNHISAAGAFPQYFFAPSYAARWFSMAVDSNNSAHITFRPEYRLASSGSYLRPYNELAYASNRSGQWNVQIVQKPRDDSGEAGNGASIAIGPDNKPYIASWYNERGPGGSSESSRLFFQSQDASSNWTQQEVISRPDGYLAGDDEKGTGFAPYLRFDAQGRPHILFLDHGSEHFSEAGQIEYAGHIRHAVRQSGGQWQVESLLRQSDPKREQMVYPAFAMNGSELVVTGLQRATVWNMSIYPPVVSSTYRFTTVTAPLR
jgi:hypothetical protein